MSGDVHVRFCESRGVRLPPATHLVILVAGTREHAGALPDEVSGVLAPIGLRLSEEKTRVCHIDEGFDFLGWRIQRRAWRGRTGKRQVYTYPSKKSLLSLFDRVRILTRRQAHRTLADLLKRVNPLLRGWCNYFRHGVCKRTFGYVDHYSWWKIVTWIRKRHAGLNWGTVRRRYLPRWDISDDGLFMFRPRSVAIVRYRYRGTKIPTPWASQTTPSPQPAA
jgi:RNA-directed DNA polymerase